MDDSTYLGFYRRFGTKGLIMKKTTLTSIFAAGILGACATTNSTETVESTIAETPEVETVVETPKYEPLIYGAEKPLICDKPFPKTGLLKNRPNMQIMWENYLYDRPEGIWSEIGGMVEVNGNLPFDQGQWTNACTVRLSHMLNKAGHKIPRDGDNKTVSGANKDQYYYRVADLEAYLIESFGAPDVAITDGSANSFDLPNAPGIVLMDFPNASYTGHVTIWNGAGTVDGANIGGYRVLFWSLPCFIPEGRNTSIADLQSQTLSLTP